MENLRRKPTLCVGEKKNIVSSGRWSAGMVQFALVCEYNRKTLDIECITHESRKVDSSSQQCGFSSAACLIIVIYGLEIQRIKKKVTLVF